MSGKGSCWERPSTLGLVEVRANRKGLDFCARQGVNRSRGPWAGKKESMAGGSHGEAALAFFFTSHPVPELDRAHLRVWKCGAFRLGWSDLASRNTGCLIQFQITGKTKYKQVLCNI